MDTGVQCFTRALIKSCATDKNVNQSLAIYMLLNCDSIAFPIKLWAKEMVGKCFLDITVILISCLKAIHGHAHLLVCIKMCAVHCCHSHSSSSGRNTQRRVVLEAVNTVLIRSFLCWEIIKKGTHTNTESNVSSAKVAEKMTLERKLSKPDGRIEGWLLSVLMIQFCNGIFR